MTFDELGLGEQLLEALSYMGFSKATPIQEMAIPYILANRDLLACAQTGTGKTAAFILPILNKLVNQKSAKINTLVIAPTRELVLQIDQQIQAFAYFVNVSSYAVYGGGDGHEFGAQKKALRRGSEIIVATPGKLMSHMNMGYVDFSGIKHFILDEADRMLDMGFYEDIKMIEKNLPDKKQTLMFSATMPHKIRKLAKSVLTDPKEISLATSKPAEGVVQGVYLVYDSQKANLIAELIREKTGYTSILIFTSTKKKVNEVVRTLASKNFDVQGVSSDLDQSQREEALRKFKALKTRILVATDVLSRGIDIKGIDLVVNYDVPSDAEDYVHRVGRTARADNIGVALTLVNESDMYKLRKIEKLIGSEIMKLTPPASFAPGPDWNSRNSGSKKRPQHSGSHRKKGKHFKKRR